MFNGSKRWQLQGSKYHAVAKTPLAHAVSLSKERHGRGRQADVSEARSRGNTCAFVRAPASIIALHRVVARFVV